LLDLLLFVVNDSVILRNSNGLPVVIYSHFMLVTL
jgi:hypothetical protein